MADTVNAKTLDSTGNAITTGNPLPTSIQGTPTVIANVGTGTQPVSGTVTANAGTGTLATSVADGANVTIGTTTDASSASTLVGILKAIKAAVQGTLTTSVSNFPASQAVTSTDGALATVGTTTDASSTTTLVGLLKAVKAAVQGTLTVSGTVTANAGTGTLATSVADGQNATIGTTTDASSANTLVGLLKAIKAAVTGTLVTNATIQGTPTVTANAGTGTFAVGQKAQTSATTTLQSGATANGNGTVGTPDGYNGALQLLISNGAGTCTVNVEGSLDNFATAQDILTLGVYKLADSTGTNTNRTILSGAIAVAANATALYAITDSYPYIRARISGASGLGAGTNVTGTTVKLYQVPN